MSQKTFPTEEPATRAAWTLTGFQVNLYAEDVEAAIAFYAALGFEESYRYPAAGTPQHVEVRNGDLTISVSSVDAARAEHGFEASQDGASVEIVLWCNDSDAAYARRLLREPPCFASPTTSRTDGSTSREFSTRSAIRSSSSRSATPVPDPARRSLARYLHRPCRPQHTTPAHPPVVLPLQRTRVVDSGPIRWKGPGKMGWQTWQTLQGRARKAAPTHETVATVRHRLPPGQHGKEGSTAPLC
jgi:hypothetical protein